MRHTSDMRQQNVPRETSILCKKLVLKIHKIIIILQEGSGYSNGRHHQCISVGGNGDWNFDM